MELVEYGNFDAIDLVNLIRNRDVSKDEVENSAKEAIRRLNPILNFIAHDVPEENLWNQDLKHSEMPFDGIPFLLKESNQLKGCGWSHASRMHADRIAVSDDVLVSKYKSLGLNILGLTTMPEDGSAVTTESVFHGATRNPWDSSRMVGGSSGGAACAVAAGVVPMAAASDGGGSIRIPAACCGVVGLKTTRGLTQSLDKIPQFPLNSYHVITRSLRDCAAMLDHNLAADSRKMGFGNYFAELDTPPPSLRIGFTTVSPSGTPVDPESAKAVMDTVELCSALGHRVYDRQIEYNWEIFSKAFLDIITSGYPFFSSELKKKGFSFDSSNKEYANLSFLAYGEQLTFQEYRMSLSALNDISDHVRSYFTEIDIFISPVTTSPALKLGEINGNLPDITAVDWADRNFGTFAPFAPIFNVMGQPALSLPLFESKSGLPIGVQFAARHYDDNMLLRIGGQFERALPWTNRIPTYSTRSAGHDMLPRFVTAQS